MRRRGWEGIGKFRTALKALTSTDNGKKLIFVVDELDRCRPDYALEVLEVIKHFFSVDNVHFVLGVNYKALEDMVSVRYGAKDYATEHLLTTSFKSGGNTMFGFIFPSSPKVSSLKIPPLTKTTKKKLNTISLILPWALIFLM